MEKKIKNRFPKFIEILIIGIEIASLFWACSLFFQEKKSILFPIRC